MIKKSKTICTQLSILRLCVKKSTLEDKLKDNLAFEIRSLGLDLHLQNQTRKSWGEDIEQLYKELNRELTKLPDTDILGKQALQYIDQWIDGWRQHTKM